MNKPNILKALLVAKCTLAFLPEGYAQSEKPNIIVILTDDQTYRAIGYNNPTIKTPHPDALAASGVACERAYVASPICTASRASMMTGLFPQQHGVVALNQGSFAPYRSSEQNLPERLKPERLKKVGYVTAFSGKSHLGQPQNSGFDTGDESRGHDDVKMFEQAAALIKSRKDHVETTHWGND